MMRAKALRQATFALVSISLAAFVFEPVSAKTLPSERAARALHERILTLDSHLDTPAVVARPGFDILKHNDWKTAFAQVDVPRMKEGGLDGGFG